MVHRSWHGVGIGVDLALGFGGPHGPSRGPSSSPARGPVGGPPAGIPEQRAGDTPLQCRLILSLSPLFPLSVPSQTSLLRNPGAAGEKRVPPAATAQLGQPDGHSRFPPSRPERSPPTPCSVTLGREADGVSSSTPSPSKPISTLP